MTRVAALLLLAVALLAVGRPAGRRRLRRLGEVPAADAVPAPLLRPGWVVVATAAVTVAAWSVGGVAAGVVSGVLALGAGGVALRRLGGPRAPAEEGGTELAGRWPLLAVCLEAGLPVAAAVTATAAPLTGAAGQALRRVAGLLELGADPADAWGTVADRPALAAFARAAARSAGTGAALAQVARAEGERLRAELADTARARAERAAVLITGPLGLCFLPAFLALGIAPVVIGLAGEALARW